MFIVLRRDTTSETMAPGPIFLIEYTCDRVPETCKVEDVLFPLGRKQRCSYLRMRIIAYITYYYYCNCLLHTKQSLCCCNLILERFAGLLSQGGILAIDDVG